MPCWSCCSPRTLAPACAALVERIDRECLQPLAQRDVRFTRACNTLLVGIADSREELDHKPGNDGYCASMASTRQRRGSLDRKLPR